MNGSGLQHGFKLQFKPSGQAAYQPLVMIDLPETTSVGESAARKSSTVEIALDDASWDLVDLGGMLRIVNPDGHFAEQKIAPAA
jgi:hypothetical protein